MQKSNFKIIHILPNLITSLSIFFGMLSIISSSNGDFMLASWLIVVCMVLDGLDGRAARLTNSSSKFGAELDSLADIVSFGVAPAMLLYFYVGVDYSKFGILVSSVFVVFGAIRLARFNVTTIAEPSVFIGVPIPAGAIFLTTWIMLIDSYGLKEQSALPLLIATLIVGVFMVSNIRYPSFKKIDLSKKNSIRIFILLIIVLSSLYLYPLEILVTLITGYIVWGFVRFIFNMIIDKKNRLKI
jgi:CDP-diacylglycerol--serine O-phosphatidyltransferase